MREVAIIGMGPAGLMAASLLSKRKDIQITLYDKHEGARKLLLTGHGRCNFTNNKAPSELKSAYHEASNFIYPALKAFSPEQVIRFAHDELGLILVEEDNNRMFPKDGDAKLVRDKFLFYIEKNAGGRVTFKRNTSVIGIKKASDSSDSMGDASGDAANDGKLCLASVRSDSQIVEISDSDPWDKLPSEIEVNYYDYVIMATGGKSFASTGSDGTGYSLMRMLGHEVTPLRAGLSQIPVSKKDQEITDKLSGVSVNANASLFVDEKKSASVKGDVLFAKGALTGPAIMELSREVVPQVENEPKEWIELDFVSDMSDEALDKKLVEAIDGKTDTKLSTLASAYVPGSVSRAILERTADELELNRPVVTEIYAREVTRQIRRKCAQNLKHMRFDVDMAPDVEKAYVTRGGVSLAQINRKTMQSKLVPSLYVIGELLDIDGASGGYNLQACFSTAFLATKSILEM